MSTVGCHILRFRSLSSTNDYAKNFAEHLLDGTVIVADEQTKGRGRFNRTWTSLKDRGLYFSIVLKPTISHLPLPIFSLLPTLAVIKAIKKVCDIDAYIKWPNDIYFEKKKISGILVESMSGGNSIKQIVLGIGINLFDTFRLEKKYPDKAAFLDKFSKTTFSKEQLLNAVIKELENYYFLIHSQKLVLKTVIKEWNSFCGHIDKSVRVINKKSCFTGIFKGINDSGEAVILRNSGKIFHYQAEHISLKEM